MQVPLTDCAAGGSGIRVSSNTIDSIVRDGDNNF